MPTDDSSAEIPLRATGSVGRIVFRAMREDPGGGPMIAPSARALEADQLGHALIMRVDTSSHGLIEPAFPMRFDDFQTELAKTRILWRKLR